jgi:RHS repeat-associated protein
MTFNYGSNNSQTSIYKYVAGTPVTNADLLSSISLTYSGTVVKDYFLGYTTSATTGRNELQTITECADSGESNCLLPTSVAYQSGTAGVSTSGTTAVSATSYGALAKGDFNGDGYPDLVYVNGSTVYVAFGSATGYGTGVSTGISSTNVGPIGDLLGSGSDGILGNVGGTWYYYTWNGSGFSDVSTGVAWPGSSSWITTSLNDTNGDGLPDLVTSTISGTSDNILNVTIRLNTGAGSAVSFGSASTAFSYTACGTCLILYFAPNGLTTGPLRSWDFNGDGRQDLLFGYAENIYGTEVYFFFQLLANGTTFTSSEVAEANGSNYSVFAVNWNNDSCSDLVLNTTVYISGCQGSPPTSFSVGATVLTALDWDGDGRTDLIVDDGSYLGVYRSTGNGIGSLQATSIAYNSHCNYFTIDVNGDGLDDLGCQDNASPYTLSYYVHSGAGTPPDLASSFTDGYGNSATPTYVSMVENNYTANNTPSYPDKFYRSPLYVVSESVLSDPSSAPGVTYNQTYQYYNAWTNLQGRGFDGFGAIRLLDSRNSLYDYQYWDQSFPYTGYASRHDHLQSNGTTEISQTLNTPGLNTLSSTSYEQRYFVYTSSATVNNWEVGGPKNGDLITTSVTSYSFDNYGNATSISKVVTDEDSASPASPYNGDTWTTATTNTPDVNTSTWCLHLFTETQVAYTATVGSSVTRTKTMTPDLTNCRYTTLITEPTSNSGLYKVTETLGYDSFGNINSDTVLGNNMPNSPASRVTTANWGTTGQFPNTLTDPSGAVTTWTYTSNQALTFGVPDSKKDANNLTTSWTYDAFGRKNKETRPDSTSTTWTWSACTSHCGWSNSVYQVAQTLYQTNGTTAIRTDTTSYDPVDRVTQTAGPNVSGTTASVQKLYNSLGLLTQQSLPFLAGGGIFQQTYGYDLRNRMTSSSRPISSTNPTLQSTTIAYEGRTSVTTDPLGHTKTTVNDVKRGLRKTTDGLGYTVTRAFDAAESLTGITDSVGNTLLSGVTYNYGLKPYRVAATDADRGAWTYTVDSLGEKIGWTDAKAQSFSMTYDSLSRPLTRTEPDTFTQWTWGSTPGSYNVGELIGECTGTGTACTSSGYAESRTFDSTGRLSTRSITLGGNPGNNTGGVFLYTLGYSSTTGFFSTLTYPISTSGTALGIQYGYGYGLLQTVTDTTDSTSTCGTTCTLWTANAMNGFGQVTQETLGNNIVLNRSYDVVTSWLTAETAGVGSGAGVVNQSYLWDDDGDLIQRQNNNLGLTESFNYDADNRLTCVALSSSCSGSTVVYDGGTAGPGNITTMSGVGTYSYPTPGSARPHAVTSITGSVNGITNPVFSYDANGNMTARASTTANVSWSSYNYPTQISGSDATGTESVSFAYGPDRQRWEQTYTGTGYSTETTYYIGGLIDEVLSSGVYNYRHYIYAGTEPVAVYSRTTSGGITMSYFLEDQQQSVSTVTSNAGAVDVNESFTPFGNRRNPTTWSGAPTTTDLNTIASLSRQGYTFQTALGQSLGLNHMNGRVQDASTGRWLSADPTIPDPTSAQSYNRYTYVGNDPLDRTDPSGMCTLGLFGSDCQIWKSAAAAVASVQAAIAPIFGKGQTSVNTPTHASTSERIANEEAQKPDTKEVHLNRNLQKITGDKSMPNERPDITTVKKDDTISRTEVRSSGQTTQELQDKLSGSRGALGGRAGTDSVVEPDVVAPRVTLPEGTVPVRIPEVVIPEIFIP